MTIERHEIYPHEHLQRDAEVIELFTSTGIEEATTSDAKNEALVSAGIAVAALGGTAMVADLLGNEDFTQVSLATVGTGVFLGLSYFTAPYLSETRIGRRIEKWAEPRRLRAEEKKFQDIKTSAAKREERDLRRKIRDDSLKSTGKKVKLNY